MSSTDRVIQDGQKRAGAEKILGQYVFFITHIEVNGLLKPNLLKDNLYELFSSCFFLTKPLFLDPAAEFCMG